MNRRGWGSRLVLEGGDVDVEELMVYGT
jgi:hypothetical protein